MPLHAATFSAMCSELTFTYTNEENITESLLARRSMSEALLLQAFRLDHLSVRTCEQWPRP